MTTAIKRATTIVGIVSLAAAVTWVAFGLGRTGRLSSGRPESAAHASGSSSGKRVRLKYGDRVSPAVLRSVSATHGASWHHAIVVIIGSGIQDLHAHISYLKVLRERYRATGLAAVCVAPAPLAAASQGLCHPFAQSGHLDWGELAELRDSLLVVTSDGRVEFSAPGTPPPDTMRQLAERFALGYIDYHAVDASGLPTFTPGGTVPDISVTRVGSPDAMRLRSVVRDGTTIIYFGTSCSTCGLRAYEPELTNVFTRRTVGGVVVLFATSADDPLVRETLSAAGLRDSPAFEVHSVSTAYATRFATGLGENGPIVVSIGAGERVSSVSQLRSGGM
jgi:hypothetical protein